MALEKLLRQKKSAIIKKWVHHVLETYPVDAKRFLIEQKDSFANPVGTTLSKEIASLYETFLEGMDADRLSPTLDRIIRIRAIQDFTPSQAVSFIFDLKRIIRSEIKGEARDLSGELSALESDLDDLALLGFDIYMRCREKLYEINANEAKNRVSRLLRKAGLICEIQNEEPVVRGGNSP